MRKEKVVQIAKTFDLWFWASYVTLMSLDKKRMGMESQSDSFK